MLKVVFKIKQNGQWMLKAAVVKSEEDVKDFCKQNPDIADWEIISKEETQK